MTTKLRKWTIGGLVGYYMMRYSTDTVCRVWQVHTSLFLKKSIAHTKIVELQAAALCLRDFNLTQYRGVATIVLPNLS